MKHPTNARLAALLREHADRIESDETPMTAISVNLDVVRDDPYPSIQRNVIPGAPLLFADNHGHPKLVH